MGRDIIKMLESLQQNIHSDVWAVYTRKHRTLSNLAAQISSELPKLNDTTEEGQVILKGIIILAVTNLEVFLKNTIIKHSGRWSEKGLNELASDRVTISEAFQISKIKNVTVEHFIANEHNFTNYNTIAHVFDRLIENPKMDVLIEEYLGINDLAKGKWKVNLMKLIELRNKLTHEDSDKISLSSIDVENHLLSALIFSVLLWNTISMTPKFPILNWDSERIPNWVSEKTKK